MAQRVPPSRLADSRELRDQAAGLELSTDTYRLSRAFVLVLLATTLDVPNYLDRGNAYRYLLLLVPLGSVVLSRLRAPTSLMRRASPPDIPLILLWPIGLAGTIYGIEFRGTTATALSVFLPMGLGLLYLGTVEDITTKELRFLLRAVAWIGSLYVILNALVNSGLVPGIAANQYRNASLLFMALGIAARVALRQWIWVVILAVLQAYIFVTYPSGTTVLVAIVMLLTFIMTSLRSSKARPVFVGLLLAGALALVAANFNATVRVTDNYFNLVGKNNANSTRLQAWQDGIERFQQSPVVGSVFSKAGVTVVTRPGGRGQFQIPYHNDYVFFLAGGGIIGIGLFVAWILLAEVTALRRHADLVINRQEAHAALLRTLLIAFNVFFVTSAFNPAIMGMSRAASIFAIYGLMMALWAPSRLRQAA